MFAARLEHIERVIKPACNGNLGGIGLLVMPVCLSGWGQG
jgi:hypothetical protein